MLPTLHEGIGGCYEVVSLMAPKSATRGPMYSFTMGNASRWESVGDWEAFIGVDFGWSVGFSTSTLILHLQTTYFLQKT
jgi:hypothetical protein